MLHQKGLSRELEVADAVIEAQDKSFEEPTGKNAHALVEQVMQK